MANDTIIGGNSEGSEAEAAEAAEARTATESNSEELKAAEEGKSPEEIKAAEEAKAAEEGKSPEEIKAAEEKAAEEKKEGAPESYTDFNMPEGMEVDPAMMETFLPLAKEGKLSQEGAQKFVDMYAKGLKASVDAHVKDWTDAMGKWQADTKADKEIGGDRFDQTQVRVNLTLKTFGNEKLSEFLEVTGGGNHVEMCRIFEKVGALLENDKIDLGNVASTETRTQAEIMYPNQGGDSA